MADKNEEVEELKKRNIELAKALEESKIAVAQRDREKLNLIRDRNELKLKLNRIRSGGAAQIRQLDAALQAAIQETLTHLVQASNAVARTLELAKTYMRDRQELDASSPRWSTLSGTPAAAERERVNRVPPLLIGGQSIQPVVSLSRTLLNSSSSSANRSPNQQNRNVTQRPVPMHILQDVYIPLTRIDAAESMANQDEDEASNIENSTEDLGLEDVYIPLTRIDAAESMANQDEDEASNIENSTEDLGLEDSGEQEMEESHNDNAAFMSPMSDKCTYVNRKTHWYMAGFEPRTCRLQIKSLTHQPPTLYNSGEQELEESQNDNAAFMSPQLLETVNEEAEPEGGDETPSPETASGSCSDNPLEGPSWLLDVHHDTQTNRTQSHLTLEPDSTTELQEIEGNLSMSLNRQQMNEVSPVVGVGGAFTPTVRRRKRTSSPHQPPSRRNSINKRVLKVVVAKMKFDDEEENSSPPKKMKPHSSPRPSPILQSLHQKTAKGVPAPAQEHPEDDVLSPIIQMKVRPKIVIDSAKDLTRFDAPSPNGATDARVIIVSIRDTSSSRRDTSASRRDTSASRRDTDENRRDNSRSVTPESDSCVEKQEGRSRRPRKQVVYREKPLNRVKHLTCNLQVLGSNPAMYQYVFQVSIYICTFNQRLYGEGKHRDATCTYVSSRVSQNGGKWIVEVHLATPNGSP
ncbi:hypothetical protein RR48_06766 [Papilio machaon]|uniref:Shugoshin C-terminal domain-containing protein n=1 Tax=Papilio machaon TaxID=76193 RepID=A0A194R621_PAPMA|nr:hypothetical protein RR48_06766 [Papilio machaon]